MLRRGAYLRSVLASVRGYRFRSVFLRYFLILTLMVLVPLVVTVRILSAHYGWAVEEQTRLSETNDLLRIRDTLDTVMRETELVALSMSSTEPIRAFSVEYRRALPRYSDYELLSTASDLIARPFGFYVHSIYLYSEITGVVLASSGLATRLEAFADGAWVRSDYEPFRGGHYLWSRVRRDPNGRLLLSVFSTVSNTKRQAVLVVNVDLQKMIEGMRMSSEGQPRLVTVCDSDGSLLFDSEFASAADPAAGQGRQGPAANGPGTITQTVPCQYKDWTISSRRSLTEFREAVRGLNRRAALVLGLLLIPLLILAFLIALRLYSPLESILSVLEHPQERTEGPPFRPSRGPDEILRIVRTIRESRDESRKMEAELLDKVARLRDAQTMALQSQIDPHFLYNTLDSLSFLSMRLSGGKNEVSEAIRALYRMLEVSLRERRQLIPLALEIEHARSYCDILSLQFGEAFTVVWEVPSELGDARVPKISLQPLIENAVHHGVKPTLRGGRVTVSAARAGDSLELSVADDGVGMEPDELAAVQKALGSSAPHADRHIGLANLSLRYRLLYGSGCSIRVASAPGAGTTIRILLPHEENAI